MIFIDIEKAETVTSCDMSLFVILSLFGPILFHIDILYRFGVEQNTL